MKGKVKINDKCKVKAKGKNYVNGKVKGWLMVR